MKGVTIFTEEVTGKKIAQVHLDTLIKHPNDFEDFMDRLVSESRATEKETNWDTIKKDLRKKGKL
jgi:hypothetical protein